MSVHCRIGRVKMKSGGADVRILRRRPVGGLGEDLIKHARGVAEAQGDEIAGFFVVSWDREGAFSVGWRRRPEESAVPMTLLPSWIAEIVRREIVTTKQVHDVLDRDYDVVPGR